MFRNCYKFNAKDSKYTNYGKFLEEKLEKLLEVWAEDLAYEEAPSAGSRKNKRYEEKYKNNSLPKNVTNTRYQIKIVSLKEWTQELQKA